MNSGDKQEAIVSDEDEKVDWETLKVQLNNVTLCYGPSNVTLKQAEEAMLRYIGYLNECSIANAKADLVREFRA